jgi:hypothetical protein
MIDAVLFLDLAKEFESIITKASDHFASGLSAFTLALTNGMTQVNGVLNKIGGGIERGSVFPSGGSFTGAGFTGNPRNGAGNNSTSIENINIILPPGASGLNEEQMSELIAIKVARALDDNRRGYKSMNLQYS